MARVIFDRVSKYFGDIVALRELDLEVHDREFLVLVGPSGSGKSTALRLIAGLEEATSGRIYIGERGEEFKALSTLDGHGLKSLQQAGITPVIITVYADRSFTFATKTPPASVLLKKAAGLEKGSAEAGKATVGKVTRAQVRQIAELKLKDLTAKNLAAAEKSIEGTARSLGLEVEG